eukprot:7331380-Prymnesium_polylepis.2
MPRRGSVVPQSNLESDAQYHLRMATAGRVACVVLPRVKNESNADFEERMAQQVKSKSTVMPKAPEPPKPKEPEDPEHADAEKEGEAPKAEEGPKASVYAVSSAAYSVDLEALNKVRAEQAAKNPASTEERKARRQATLKAVLGSKGDDEDDEPTGASALSKEEADKKVQELVERRKEEQAAREKAKEEAKEAAKDPVNRGKLEVDFAAIGFMQFKKLLADRGAPKDALFGCANKVALKELAMKESETCKLVVV